MNMPFLVFLLMLVKLQTFNIHFLAIHLPIVKDDLLTRIQLPCSKHAATISDELFQILGRTDGVGRSWTIKSIDSSKKRLGDFDIRNLFMPQNQSSIDKATGKHFLSDKKTSVWNELSLSNSDERRRNASLFIYSSGNL